MTWAKDLVIVGEKEHSLQMSQGEKITEYQTEGKCPRLETICLGKSWYPFTESGNPG